MFPKTVIRLPVFTHLSSSQPGPVTRHLVLSAERPVLLVSKISHQQEPLCGTRQKEADRSPELSHYGPQTAEDNRNRLKLCWTIAFEWGCWTLKALLTMKKPLNAQHQAKTRVQYILFPKITPSLPPSLRPTLPSSPLLPDNIHAPSSSCSCHWMWSKLVSVLRPTEVTRLTIYSLLCAAFTNDPGL